ncbi:ATP-binding protein [Acinetobacter sp. Marseille-Q1618]|uniref:ATP-binding protein n=1 Tax=Acinetobacter sp. Marseille-Q1618 TaxID=2697502 RepID=UPI00156F81DB|nr:ATP-binding protein [Acinetobacter sp. Marseille-Q1618]
MAQQATKADTRRTAKTTKAKTVKVKDDSRVALTGLELALIYLAKLFKSSAEDYCEIETVDGQYNLVLQNGALMTLIRYDGIRSTIDYNNTFLGEIDRLNTYLSNPFKTTGHKIMWMFRRDLDGNAGIDRIVDIQKQTAKTLGLNLNSFIDEMKEIYEPYLYDEQSFIACITHPNLLDSAEIKNDQQRLSELAERYNVGTMKDAQNLLHGLPSLKAIHDTFVQGILNELQHTDFNGVVEKLDVSGAITSIGRMMNPRYFDPNYKAFIPNSNMPIPLRWKKRASKNDYSEVLYPKISDQLMIQTITPLGSKDKAGDITVPKGSVEVGDLVYTPIPLSTPPSPSFSGMSSVMPTFINFFDRMNQQTTELSDGSIRAIPYAVSFMLTGDGMSTIGLKRSLASLVGWQGAANAQLKSAGDALNHYKEQGGTVCGLQISVMTWDEKNEKGLERLQIRKAKLWRAIQNWGYAVPIERTGDLVQAYTTHFPLAYKHYAPIAAAPLPDALHLLPLDRPASPFKKGTMVQRTPCGKLMKLEHFSDELAYNYTIICGGMGSGKSMQMNNELFEAGLAAGLDRLPYIFITDVGLTSSGLVYGFQNALDPSRKHLCVYKRLSKSTKDAINPLETAVGFQFPISNEFDQMRSFLVTLVTAQELDRPEPEMSNVITNILKETFIFYSTDNDQSQPKLYQRGQSGELDHLLYELKITVDPSKKLRLHDLALLCHESAEEITDLTAANLVRQNKLYRARNLAHRYAMPILPDCISIAKSDTLKRLYGNYNMPNGENILDAVTRALSQVAIDYPNFNTYTEFDIADARIASIDLQDVIKKNNAKNNSLFFQIVRMFYKKRIAYSEEDLVRGEIPLAYLDYYARLVTELKVDKKYMVFDEMHNIKSDKVMVDELERDSREARKWGIAFYLSSQYISDFGILTKAARRFVVCSAGSTDERADIINALKLTDAQVQRLTSIVGLRPTGMTYLSKTINKENKEFVQFLTSMVGSKRMWLLSTDPDDQAIRSLLRKRYDLDTVINMLSTIHPRGVKSVIQTLKEERALQLASSSMSLDQQAEAVDSVYDEVAEDVVNTYNYISAQRAS